MYDNTVTHCLKCGGKLKHVPGRKRKMYCSVSCKNGLHQMQKRSLRPPGKPGRPKKPASAIESTDLKPFISGKVKSKSDKVPAASSPVPKKDSKKPTTLAELKALCPADLKGLERSEWIAKQRQKLGI